MRLLFKDCPDLRAIAVEFFGRDHHSLSELVGLYVVYRKYIWFTGKYAQREIPPHWLSDLSVIPGLEEFLKENYPETLI